MTPALRRGHFLEMAGTVADTEQEELEANIQAYLRIFQAVLKKKAGDAARKKAVLQKLNAYLRKNITTPDAIIDHIPQFSRALGVPEAALGNFIGANFIRALQQVKEELSRKKVDAAATEKAAARENEVRTFDSVLEELIYRFGGVVEAPNEFQPIDDGLMKLVTPSGEVMPASLSGNGGGPEAAAVPEAAPEKAAAASSAGKSSEAAAPGSTAKAAPAPPVREKPLLDEILEKFGNVLDIPGKLEPSVWEDEQTAAPAGAGRGESPAGADAAGPTPTTDAPSAAPAKAKASPRAAEKPLLDEILEKFGNVLDIPGKLEPSVWEEEEASVGGGSVPAAASGGSSVDAGAAGLPVESEAPAEPDFEPIPMGFGEYAAIQKKVQSFQTSGDQAGYKAWLAGPAGLAGKTLVGLRNLDARERKGESVNWSDEYYSLSLHLNADVRQVEDFHLRIKYFIRIQQTISQLTKTIKSGGAAMLGAAQKIWPQVLQIFHQAGDAHAYESQLKIILLQVGDPALKKKLIEALHPAFEQVAEIYKDLDH